MALFDKTNGLWLTGSDQYKFSFGVMTMRTEVTFTEVELNELSHIAVNTNIIILN